MRSQQHDFAFLLIHTFSPNFIMNFAGINRENLLQHSNTTWEAFFQQSGI